MNDDLKPEQPEHQEAKAQLPFQPAANPFEHTESPQPPAEPAPQPEQPATTPQAPAPEEKKKSAFGLSFGRKKPTEPEPPKLTEATVAGKTTTLVGKTAQTAEGEPAAPQIPEEILFDWQAPEFAYTNKPFGWFLALGAFIVVLIGVAIWTQQWITIVLLAVMGVAIGVWANRKPKTLEYKLSNYGVYVNGKKYLFDDFREFYEFMDYTQKTVDLVPAKRFGTLVSLPLATPEAEAIEETLGHMVPKAEHHEDIIDKIVRKLRF